MNTRTSLQWYLPFSISSKYLLDGGREERPNLHHDRLPFYGRLDRFRRRLTGSEFLSSSVLLALPFFNSLLCGDIELWLLWCDEGFVLLPCTYSSVDIWDVNLFERVCSLFCVIKVPNVLRMVPDGCRKRAGSQGRWRTRRNSLHQSLWNGKKEEGENEASYRSVEPCFRSLFGWEIDPIVDDAAVEWNIWCMKSSKYPLLPALNENPLSQSAWILYNLSICFTEVSLYVAVLPVILNVYSRRYPPFYLISPKR